MPKKFLFWVFQQHNLKQDLNIKCIQLCKPIIIKKKKNGKERTKHKYKYNGIMLFKKKSLVRLVYLYNVH